MEPYKITKPVRLIEVFAGIGSQAMALKRLGVDFEHWKISEWEVNCVKSYKAIHMPDDNTDYSEGLTREELANYLYEIGISSDGKKPLTLQQVNRKGEKWLREIYNCFKATHNVGSITNITIDDLELGGDASEKSTILTYSFP